MINFEKSLQEKDTQKKEDNNLVSLNLTNDEKDEAIRNIIKELSNQGHEVNPDEVKFPSKKNEIEDLIYGYPQYFNSKYLVEIIKKNSEFAPKLTKELTNREEYGELLKILRHYTNKSADKPIFEYCVRQIESSLKNNDLQDRILMDFSVAMENTKEINDHESKIISKYEVEMKANKKTARPINEYQRLLKIQDEELKKNLQNNELLIVGGGFSPIKNELINKNIDCAVTNIDPIAKSDKNIADNVIKKDFFDVLLEQNKYTEIWALHSLPTYAFTPKQAEDFYTRSILSLKQNGVLRVAPIDKFSDSFTPAMRLSRKPVNNASIKFIEKLKNRSDLFSVTDFTIEHKGALGKKTQMRGVKIKIIGDEEQIKNFLDLDIK